MARNQEIQFSFAAGMLDPELAARGDTDMYYQGALDLTNFTIDPRGGAVVRDGTGKLAELTDAASGVRFHPFVFEPGVQDYLLVFTNLRLRVYKDGTEVADVVTPFAGSSLAAMAFAQSFDTLICTSKTVQPYQVQRQGSDSAWAVEPLTISSVWEAKFRRTFPNIAITPAATSGNGVTLTASTTWFRSADVGAKIEGNSGEATIASYVSATEVTIDISQAFASTAEIAAYGWIFDQTDCTISPAADITPDKVSGAVVTIDASQNVFRSHHAGGTISGNGGVATITAVISENQVEVETTTDFTDTSTIASASWTLAGIDLTEPAWSGRRGWPVSCGLHEGRLYLSSPRDLPNRSFGSRVNDPADFEQTLDAFDDDPVSVELSGAQLARIRHIFSVNGLHLLTGAGVFSQRERPITPKNFAPQLQAAEPAAAVQPVELESGLIYVQQADDGTGLTVQEVVFDEVRQAFGGQDLTALAATVINNPQQLSVRRGNASDTATHLLTVNADGTAAIMNSRRRQNLAAWTKWTTDGEIMQQIAVGGVVYWLVKRTIDSVVRYYLEEMRATVHCDSAVIQTSGTAKTTWTGLDHLEGKTVTLKGGGVWLGTATVSGGSVTVPDPVSDLEAGLPRAWRYESMPVLRLAKVTGAALGKRHRILSVTTSVRETQDLTVNGRKPAFRRMGTNLLDQPVPAFTGELRVRQLGFRGGRRGTRATVVMEGEAPLPTKIEAISLEIGS